MNNNKVSFAEKYNFNLSEFNNDLDNKNFRAQTKIGKIFIMKYMDYLKGKITTFKNLNNNKNVILRIETELNNNNNLLSISCLCGKKYNIDPYHSTGFSIYRRILSLMSKHLIKCQNIKSYIDFNDIELSINEFLKVSKSDDQNFGQFRKDKIDKLNAQIDQANLWAQEIKDEKAKLKQEEKLKQKLADKEFKDRIKRIDDLINQGNNLLKKNKINKLGDQ